MRNKRKKARESTFCHKIITRNTPRMGCGQTNWAIWADQWTNKRTSRPDQGLNCAKLLQISPPTLRHPSPSTHEPIRRGALMPHEKTHPQLIRNLTSANIRNRITAKGYISIDIYIPFCGFIMRLKTQPQTQYADAVDRNRNRTTAPLAVMNISQQTKENRPIF